MHTIRGEHRHGIIIDPGAASALMGTETLRRYLQMVLQPKGIRWTTGATDKVFTGIDGIPDKAQDNARSHWASPACREQPSLQTSSATPAHSAQRFFRSAP